MQREIEPLWDKLNSPEIQITEEEFSRRGKGDIVGVLNVDSDGLGHCLIVELAKPPSLLRNISSLTPSIQERSRLGPQTVRIEKYSDGYRIFAVQSYKKGERKEPSIQSTFTNKSIFTQRVVACLDIPEELIDETLSLLSRKQELKAQQEVA